jgi:hypothetical protein
MGGVCGGPIDERNEEGADGHVMWFTLKCDPFGENDPPYLPARPPALTRPVLGKCYCGSTIGMTDDLDKWTERG